MEVCKQQQAIELINKGENVLMLGAGGVGKSYVIKQIADDSTLVLAPTGIAALNIGGMTCHRAFKLPLGLPTQKDRTTVHRSTASLFSSSKITRIVIDEVGMLRTDVLDLIDLKLQKIKRNKLPFGGIQMVLVGDFFQLEPIVGYREQSEFYSLYDSPFCFSSAAFSNFHTIELTKVYRQEDERQVKILDAIRKGTKYSWLALQRINEESKVYNPLEDRLHLCAYKKDAEVVNTRRYNEIKDKAHIFKATLQGKQCKWTETPVGEIVRLKEGCKVVVCANDPDGEYVNGDRGVILRIEGKSIGVELLNGNLVWIEEYTWEKHSYKGTGKKLTKVVENSMTQIPLALGWAISIHKSQGMTLDDVVLDTGKGCFSHGQLYVALSRIKDLRRLSLTKPLTTRELIVRDDVTNYYRNINIMETTT